jgi:hypothetical protein
MVNFCRFAEILITIVVQEFNISKNSGRFGACQEEFAADRKNQTLLGPF